MDVTELLYKSLLCFIFPSLPLENTADLDE